MILSVDIEKERIGLGVKQLNSGENEQVVEQLNNLKKVTLLPAGLKKLNVMELKSRSAKRQSRATSNAPDLSKDRSEQRPDRFAIGDRVDAKIISVNAKKGRSACP